MRAGSTGKRQLSPNTGTGTSAFPKTPRLDANQVLDQFSEQDKFLEKAKTILSEVDSSLGPEDPSDKTSGLIRALSLALQNIIKSSDALKSSMIDIFKASHRSAAPSFNNTSSPAYNSSTGFYFPKPPKAQGEKTAPFSFADAASMPPPKQAPKQPKRTPPVLSPEETQENKVKKSLREAERSSVLFELDMGQAPILNKDTISRKVTQALHGVAAAGNHDYNIRDAAVMIDDILSISTLDILGSGTRKYYNSGKTKDGQPQSDTKNGKFCTVPVKLNFKNKENRIEAETTLRALCKTMCSVSYPKKLRAMLGDLIKKGKAIHKEAFIRTKIDIENLTVHVSAKVNNSWLDLDLSQKIPLDILDKFQPLKKNPEPTVMDSEDGEGLFS